MATITIPDKAIEWLENGEHGVSSETIFSALTGLHLLPIHRWDTPSDPSDFRRCCLLVESVPEFAARLQELKTLGAPWARLVDSWDWLVQSFDGEAPGWRGSIWWSAPKTYKRMKALKL